jgi:putative membrane protein
MTLTSVLVWFLVLCAVVAVAVTAVRRPRPVPLTARQLLDQRYARGDIDKDEYRRRLHELVG